MMRLSPLPTALLVVAAVSVGGSGYGAPEFPDAERAVQDDVDHWGQAFSDQHRLFEERFRAFEKHTGHDGLDYVLGVETSLRKTFPNKYSFKGEFADTVDLWTARNEAEAFQLAVLPRMGFDLEEVVVTASDLVKGEGADNAVIPADAVRLWRVGFVETQQPPYPVRKVGLWPDPLLEIEPFSLTGLDLGLVWIEVKTPADAAPGDYVGTVTVRASNARALQLTVRLHVWDFALPDRIPMPMLVWTRESGGEDFLEIADLLLAHHVDPISVGRNTDLDELDRSLEFCLARGLMFF